MGQVGSGWNANNYDGKCPGAEGLRHLPGNWRGLK